MRTLKFIVDKQDIKQDPNCDFGGLVPGTEGYLRAEFSFSPEWSGCVKVAAFRSRLGREYPPQVLEDGKTCIIPTKALKNQIFSVQVMGKKEGLRLVTNKMTVSQNGGRT